MKCSTKSRLLHWISAILTKLSLFLSRFVLKLDRKYFKMLNKMLHFCYIMLHGLIPVIAALEIFVYKMCRFSWFITLINLYFTSFLNKEYTELMLSCRSASTALVKRQLNDVKLQTFSWTNTSSQLKHHTHTDTESDGQTRLCKQVSNSFFFH